MAQRAPFPYNPDEFDTDTRISYSKELRTFLLEDENGEEWEWLSGLSKWSKTMDEELMKQQAEIYKIPGVDEDAPALDPAKKRKAAQLEDLETNPKDAKASAGSHAIANARAGAGAGAKVHSTNANVNAMSRQNTAIFVTGLPQDADSEEIKKYFERFGMLAESIDDNKKRIKLYNDQDGNFKGEALLVYYRPESVDMALEIADGDVFPSYDGSIGPMSVTAADSSYKAHKDETVAEDRPSKANVKAMGTKDKAKAKKKKEQMESRLADWDDDDLSTVKQTSSRFDKVVVIKHVFTLQGLEEDPNFLEDIMADMKEGAEPHGEVKNITIFDQEQDGVVTIRFSNTMGADACASAFDGRFYDSRKLEASIATGNEKFKKSRKAPVDADEEKKRLEDYSNFIEGKDDGDSANGGAKS